MKPTTRSRAQQHPRSTPRRRARGQERRRLLLETTLELIADEGVHAVSHRRVAEHAGVPLGSTTYYFASREDMLVQALEYFARREIETLEARVGAFATGSRSARRLVDALSDFLLPQVGAERSRTVAQYALFGEAARHPELAPVVRDWTSAWTAILERIFERLGRSDPRLEARMFLAMLDGLVFGQLAAPDDAFEQELLRPALRRWIVGE